MSKQRGYSPFAVGIILTISPLPSLVMRPLFGAIVDKYKCPKLALMTTIVIGFMTVCALMLMPGPVVYGKIDDDVVFRTPLFWLYLTTIVIFHTTISIRGMVEDTICVNLLGDDKHKYGEQRVWGSVGWGTISIISGACVDWFSKGQKHKNYLPCFITSLTLYALDFYDVSKIKIVQKQENSIIKTDLKKLFMTLFTTYKVLIFIFWIIILGFFDSFIMYFYFWYLEDLSNIYHPETKPWIKTIQGLTLTIQCFGGNFPFFYLSSFILKRVKAEYVVSSVFLTFAVRFFLYSVIENPFWVLPVEFLNGITFALALSTIISYMCRSAPTGIEATVMGIIYTALYGIGVPIGSFVGGYLFNRFGSIFSFKILSGMAVTSCVLHIVVTQLTNRLSKPKNSEEEAR
ncbi:Hypothetical protein CINCED_3A015748 [Cinara cedri]|nr:Hypothetical protein CINCED_3A015748 [Cinara cedri]